MKRKLITMVIVAAVLGGIIVVNQYEPARLAQAHYEAEQEAQLAIEDASQRATQEQLESSRQEMQENFLMSREVEEQERLAQEAEAKENPNYKVLFECSNGNIELEVKTSLAPIGAAQFKEAIEDGVYDGARFFRVIPGFMVQFGIPGDPEQSAKWKAKTIKDDPVKASNTRGTLTFATSGPNSRTTQLFINFADKNSFLDNQGFAPFAKVTKGMDVVDSINAQHRERPDQGAIQELGNAYLESKFPELDYIKKATVIEIQEEESKEEPEEKS